MVINQRDYFLSSSKFYNGLLKKSATYASVTVPKKKNPELPKKIPNRLKIRTMA